MAIKKTLYEVLQVSRTASGEVITSAYEARVRALGDSAASEVIAEKGILRDAHAILSDAVRRKLYDEKLREEAIRAMASGTGDAPRVPASATLAADATSTSSPLGWMIGVALLVAVGVGGAWTYFSHKRAVDAARIEETRLAEQKRLQEEVAQRERDNSEWAKAQYEQRQKEAEMRRWEQQRERERVMSQHQTDQWSRQRAMDERQKTDADRRAAYERQRIEQENLRRSQTELHRQQRYLQELERDRAMKF